MNSIIPDQYCSQYAHKNLYIAYDNNPELWKASLYDHLIERTYSFDWSEEKIEQYNQRSFKRVQEASVPHDLENCDYWLFKRMNNAIRYTKHASCQWMSFINWYLARQVMPSQDWFHVADDDMNNGQSHYYVINGEGKILDPQGLALDFNISDYQLTFNEDKITAEEEVLERIEFHSECYFSR